MNDCVNIYEKRKDFVKTCNVIMIHVEYCINYREGEFTDIVLIHAADTELKDIVELVHSLAKDVKVAVYDSYVHAQDDLVQESDTLIFLDADDEQEDWICLLNTIKAVNQDVKVVLMSKNALGAVRAYEEGAWDYLLKPVMRRQMERVLNKYKEDIHSNTRTTKEV